MRIIRDSLHQNPEIDNWQMIHPNMALQLIKCVPKTSFNKTGNISWCLYWLYNIVQKAMHSVSTVVVLRILSTGKTCHRLLCA